MKKFLLLLFLPSLSFAASRNIDGQGLKREDKAALNMNFQKIDSELSNAVHKTSTETIKGFKYFTNNTDFTTVTGDAATITDITATTLATGSLSVTGAAPGPPAANTLYKDNIIKGWINFEGTGTIAINDSFNVSGIVDNGTGDYTVTWDRDFASANYAPIITGGSSAVGNNFCIRIGPGSADPASHILAGSLRLLTASGGGTAADSERLCVVAIGDQ